MFANVCAVTLSQIRHWLRSAPSPFHVFLIIFLTIPSSLINLFANGLIPSPTFFRPFFFIPDRALIIQVGIYIWELL